MHFFNKVGVQELGKRLDFSIHRLQEDTNTGRSAINSTDVPNGIGDIKGGCQFQGSSLSSCHGDTASFLRQAPLGRELLCMFQASWSLVRKNH